jgi:LAO/AO transport system kinase
MKAKEEKRLIEDLHKGQRRALARAITILESDAKSDREQAARILAALESMTSSQKIGLRLGITGPPGVGKSTWIEAFGTRVLSKGLRLCVLPVDPTSPVSGGSLLGDRTRMENLSRSEDCFIRPSPSGRKAGGVSEGTRDVLRLCELLDFDILLVETVGVGQNELDVCSMVDLTILLFPPFGGDELQGLKKGILEIADIYFVNKFDVAADAAQSMKQDLLAAFSVFPSFLERGRPEIYLGSALSGDGVSEVLDTVLEQTVQAKSIGTFQQRRRDQELLSFREGLKTRILRDYFAKNSVQQALKKIEKELQSGRLGVGEALKRMLKS